MALSIKQKILLELMVKCDQIMREHDIEYLLFGGSTLGALRHKGFIPWDDDIDIIMDAENYYKLEEVFKDGPIDDIDLVFFNRDSNWYRSFAMLVNLEDTCYTTPVMYSDGKATGSRIDVMICDYVPTDRLEEYRHDLMLYEEVLTDSMMIDINVFEIKDEYLALREREAEIGKIELEKELRNNLESYASGSDDDEVVVRFWTEELRHYKRDLLFPALYHEFEGYQLPIPAKPEEQMRLQFGNDWYIIPAQDDFMLHAFTDNYYISGNNYHEDVMQFIDVEKSTESVRNRKAVLLERAGYAKENRTLLHNLAHQREVMRANFKNNEDLYKQLIENERYEDLYERLEDLLAVISDTADVKKEHKQIPLNIMKAWLKSCIYCGKYNKASQITKAYELTEDDSFKEELHLIERVFELADAFQDRKKEEMRERLAEFSESEKKIIPDCIFCIAELSKDKDGRFGDNSDKLSDMCDDYLQVVTKNYEVKKLKADILYEQGKTDEAMELYADIHENTINGMDLYDLEQRFGFGPRFTQEEKDPLDIMLGI